ncbi:putative Cyclic nucleotide-gated cation channel [Fasciolopsis buskii]|uniref:Putative Cyclic nucleotide-gated cation channel n=1 Tax=Fasciolopsis buskii TaxID=27845 RepID=A0A8E0S3Q2_9TREM|nr:putative Cyclic nucleotide-gated cation channel [Fasciolopsis buski]
MVFNVDSTLSIPTCENSFRFTEESQISIMSDTVSGSACVNASSFCDHPNAFEPAFEGLHVKHSTKNETVNKSSPLRSTGINRAGTSNTTSASDTHCNSRKNNNAVKNFIYNGCSPTRSNCLCDSSSAQSANSVLRLPMSEVQDAADCSLLQQTSSTGGQSLGRSKHPKDQNIECGRSPSQAERSENNNQRSNLVADVRGPAVANRQKLRDRRRSRRESLNWGCIYFSPSGRGLHLWCGVISMAVVYHMWVIIYRYVFAEICRETIHIWFPLDYLADFLYMVDMVVSIRTGFLEDGVMQYNSKRMRIHYINSTQFYVDCLSLLPLDFLYLSVGFNSMLRIFRLCKLYKFWQFLDRAERHSTYPNIMRSAKLLFYYLTILHWNACVFKLVNDFCDGLWDPTITKRHEHGNSSRTSKYAETVMKHSFNASNAIAETDVSDHEYVHSLYWGLLSLISIGSVHKPNGLLSYLFLISQGILGVLLFATVLGHVSNIVAHVSAGQKEFQGKLN